MASSLVEEVAVPSASFTHYQPFGKKVYSDCQAAAEKVRGKTIVHINSTEKGGGVAELLRSQVPLERDLGLNSHWLVIRPAPAFFNVTKKIHNLLQGGTQLLTPEDEKLYADESKRLSQSIARILREQQPNIVVIHDPQPLLATVGTNNPVKKILRLHIDLCQPNPSIIPWLCRYIPNVQHTIISRDDCRPLCMTPPATTIIPPAIDPLVPKNMSLPLDHAKKIIKQHGIDISRPLITQISRFDHWKDPLGVIDAYQEAKEKIPDLQLALVGFFQADDDPEAADYFKHVQAAAASNADIHLFSDLKQLQHVSNDGFINAMQTASDIILQKSTREGFGLTVTEAMWKGKAVIGGNTGGIKLQISDDQNGVLVDSPSQAAEAILRLIHNAALRRRLGKNAQESVRKKYLMPHYLLQHLRLYQKLLQPNQGPHEPARISKVR